MNFKNWFLLTETSNIVHAKDLNQDEILLYHGTTTGENNQRIESFKKEGAKPIGIGHGQGGGFYVSNKIEKTKDHALSLLKKDKTFDVGATHSGNPMVVVIALDSMNFNEWDFDAETMHKMILSRADKMIQKQPNKTWKGTLSPKSIEYLQKDQNPSVSNFDKDPSISVQKTPLTTLRQKYQGGEGYTFNLPSSKFYDPAEPFGTNPASHLSLAYQAHQDSSKGRHEKLEAAAFKKIYNNKSIDLKYTGSNPLPIKAILVFENGEWKNV